MPILHVVIDSDYSTFGFDERGDLCLYDEHDHAPVIWVQCQEVDEWEGVYDQVPGTPPGGERWRKRNPSPTEEGLRRHPDEGYYIANETPGPPCTCKRKCPDPCKGQCGCVACGDAYGDFLSTE